MPKLSDMLKHQVTLVVSYRDLNICISFRPDAVTAARQAEFERQIACGELERYMADSVYLAGILTSWDITDDDQLPLPITIENLSLISTSLAEAIIAAIHSGAHSAATPPPTTCH